MKIKHPKSPTLTAILKDWSKPVLPSKAERELLAFLTDYPHNFRGEVFCWLWDNHAALSKARSYWGLTWRGAAAIMAEDGVKDANGAVPNANAVRRVWGRGCREIEADKAEKAREAGR